MGQKLIRITEGELHEIVKESVKRALKEGSLGDLWGGIKRGAYQMTHRPEAMADYDKKNSHFQRQRDDYADQERQRVIKKGLGREKGRDFDSRRRRRMINQREGF